MIPHMFTPESWHLTPEHVRHLCGSPAKVKPAPPEPPCERRISSFHMEPAEIFPGVTIEAPPLAAPLAPLVESALRLDARERVRAAIAQTASELGLGATVLEICQKVSALPERRIREILESERLAGRLKRTAPPDLPVGYRERIPLGYLWSLA